MESQPPIRLHLFMFFITFTHSFSIDLSKEFLKLGENENITGHVSKQYRCPVPTRCAIG